MGQVWVLENAYRSCVCSELVQIAKPIIAKERAEEEMARHEFEASVIARTNDFLRINPGFKKLLATVSLPRVDKEILANENRICLKSRR